MNLDKTQMKVLLNNIITDFCNDYYVSNPPSIVKHDKIELGLGSKHNTTNSIHYSFKTTKPSQSQIELWIKIKLEEYLTRER
jgi:hypothetical protein